MGYRPGVMDKAIIRRYFEHQKSNGLSVPGEINFFVSEVLRLYYQINRYPDGVMTKVGLEFWLQ